MQPQIDSGSASHLDAAEVQSNQLKAILYLLQTNIEKMKDEVDRTYDLYAVGEVTELAKKIERMLSDPVKTVINASYNIDLQVKDMLNKIVVEFFKHKRTVLNSAYLTKSPSGTLHYTIILNEDTNDSRSDMMEFFDWYLGLGIDERYPVVFQFVPNELISKINTGEKLL